MAKELFKTLPNGQWELKKSVEESEIEHFESLCKSLFPTETAMNTVPVETNEESKPKKKDIACRMKYAIDDLKNLKDLKWVVTEEWNKKTDKATQEKIKEILEVKYNEIKKEINDLVKKFSSAE